MKRIVMGMVLLLAAGAAGAQTYDLRELTPAVRAALDARKERFAELRALKSRGLLGETNRGYVEALGGGKAEQELADNENRDRALIYRAIVEQNGLGAGALATVEAVFAGVQRNKAEPGDRVQTPDGDWR